MGSIMMSRGPHSAGIARDASEVRESGGVAITWEELLGIGGDCPEVASESPDFNARVKPFAGALHGGEESMIASLTSTRREAWRRVGDGPAKGFDADLRRRRDLLMKTSGANRNSTSLPWFRSPPSPPSRSGSGDRCLDSDQDGEVDKDEGGNEAVSPSVEDSAIGVEGRVGWLLFKRPKDGGQRPARRRAVEKSYGGQPELQVRRWRSDSSMGNTARRDASLDSRELPGVLEMVRSVPDIHRELALERAASPLSVESQHGRGGDGRLDSSASWSTEYQPEARTEEQACAARMDSGILTESEDMAVDCCPWINLRYEDMMYTGGGRWAGLGVEWSVVQ
ncbi:unnamed protein product [Ostreobium quekettii]|uniref:Uncharacterized protein n=1 Tax=Ostreobium quekettii TaxID=121088 RepID=A0A8S1JCJ6_9CHLO|nr:unnamed protein product [Ostreobium quekettii]|eukprot:evm.model.scf_3829.1 EVM.evm.TU.scf_3829.1   scf_3829:4126-5139(+)